jgi:hypothetical protein
MVRPSHQPSAPTKCVTLVFDSHATFRLNASAHYAAGSKEHLLLVPAGAAVKHVGQALTAADACCSVALSSAGGRASSQSRMWSTRWPVQRGLLHMRPVGLKPTCTAQHSTAQHSTAQHSIPHHGTPHQNTSALLVNMACVLQRGKGKGTPNDRPDNAEVQLLTG